MYIFLAVLFLVNVDNVAVLIKLEHNLWVLDPKIGRSLIANLFLHFFNVVHIIWVIQSFPVIRWALFCQYAVIGTLFLFYKSTVHRFHQACSGFRAELAESEVHLKISSIVTIEVQGFEFEHVSFIGRSLLLLAQSLVNLSHAGRLDGRFLDILPDALPGFGELLEL